MSVKASHFIPVTCDRLISFLDEKIVCSTFKSEFRSCVLWLEQQLQKEFRCSQKALVNAYASIDPDSDTIELTQSDSNFDSDAFKDKFTQVLTQANFFSLSQAEIQSALGESSLFNIRLDIDFSAFEDVIVYCRGESQKQEVIGTFFGLFKKNVTFINYDRVVIYLRFKSNTASLSQTELLGRAGRTMLKLFRNVPKADIEMLFPNTRIGMRLMDKILIGVPALISGIIVVTTKLGTTLVLLGALLGFWLGVHQKPVELNTATLLVLGAGLGTLIGYCWKQFSVFKNRKLKFSQALTQNLYFKSLDNNAGVIYRIIAEAEAEEFKEALLAWYFLHQNPRQNANQLDSTIERWFSQMDSRLTFDFDIHDALNKLSRLGLATQENGLWQATNRADVSPATG